MHYSLLILASLVSVLPAQYLYPPCAQHCFEVGSACSDPGDDTCRCAEKSLLTDAPCCVIQECPLIDQLHALEWYEGICADVNAAVNFTGATCNGVAIHPGSAVPTITISTWSSSSSSVVSDLPATNVVTAVVTVTDTPLPTTDPAAAGVTVVAGTNTVPVDPTVVAGTISSSTYPTYTIPVSDQASVPSGIIALVTATSVLGSLAVVLAIIGLVWRRRKLARKGQPLPPVHSEPPPYTERDTGVVVTGKVINQKFDEKKYKILD